MESQDPKIDSLHQKASAQYLQGEFQAALQTWRELLALDPEDDRALEGVKLCEMLAEDGSATAAPAAEQAQAPRPTAAESVEGFDDDLEELDAILGAGAEAAPTPEAAAQTAEPAGGLEFEFSAPEEQGVDKPAAPSTDGPERRADGIDLGTGNDTPPLELGTAEQPPSDVKFEFDPQSIDMPAQSEEQPAQNASPSETAAAELRHRVNELLSEAQTLHEGGDREGAIGVLNRIFILDESNEAAIGLRELINSEIAAVEQPSEPAEPAADGGFGFDEIQSAETAATDAPSLELDAMPAVGAPPEVEMTPAEMATPETGQATESGQTVESDQTTESEVETPAEFEEELQQEAEPSVELSVGMPKVSLKEKLTLPKLAIAAGILVAVAAGGFSAYWFMWGPGASESSEEAASGEPSVAGTVPTVLPEIPGQNNLENADAAAAIKKKRPEPREEIDVDALAAQADRAFRGGNYSDAVVYYNQLLEAEPDNRPAKAKLEQAAERYRAERELEEKRAEAFDAFNNGNYRAALSIFYRMPEGENQRRLDRYQRNGWYNMGLQALEVGDCTSAKTNLKEAQALDPNDKEVILALDLARICRYSRGEASFQEEIDALVLRGLDD